MTKLHEMNTGWCDRHEVQRLNCIIFLRSLSIQDPFDLSTRWRHQ